MGISWFRTLIASAVTAESDQACRFDRSNYWGSCLSPDLLNCFALPKGLHSYAQRAPDRVWRGMAAVNCQPEIDQPLWIRSVRHWTGQSTYTLE
jgi:hypothetical protein